MAKKQNIEALLEKLNDEVAAGSLTQATLDDLVRATEGGKNKNVVATLRGLLEQNVISSKDGKLVVPTAAPSIADPEVKPGETAAKKMELTEAQRAEMAAAEVRAREEAQARRAAEQKKVEELEKERAAEKARKAAAVTEEPKSAPAPAEEKPKAPTAKKSTSSKPSKPTVPSAGEKTPGLVPVRTRETALERTPSPAPRTPAAGVDVEKPSRQEQRARIEGIKKGAATRAVASREGIPVKLSDIQKNIDEGDVKGAVQKLGGHNFKQAFGRLTSETRNKLLTQVFGSNLSGLNTAQVNQLGEMAMALNVLKTLGLTEMPEFQRLDKGISELADQIKGAKSGELAKSGIDKRIQALHGGLLTGEGKIRTEVMRLPSEERGVRREAALRRQRDAEAAAKKEARRMSTIPATGKGKKKTAPKKGLVDVPELGAGQPAAPAPAAAPGAAPAAAVPDFETTPTPAATSTTIGKENAAKLKQVLSSNNIEEKTLLAQINKAGKDKKGFVPVKKLEDIPANLQPRVDSWVAKTVAKRGGPAVAAASSSVSEFSSGTAPKGTLLDVLGPTASGAPAPAGAPASAAAAAPAPATAPATAPVGPKASAKEVSKLRSSLGRISPDAEVGLLRAAQAKGLTVARLEDLPKSELAWARKWAAGSGASRRPVGLKKLPDTDVSGRVMGPYQDISGRVMGPSVFAEAGPRENLRTQKQPRVGSRLEMLKSRAGRIRPSQLAKSGGRALGFVGPLFAAFTAYQLLSMLKGGTVDAADENRLKAMQALGAVGQGAQADLSNREQLRQMQRMVDLAAIQRQQQLDQMRQQYTQDSTMDAIIRGNQASLAALAQPSRPSIAEMMARY